MKNLSNLEKKINSELTTKVKSSKLNHNQIYLNIENENLLEVILFLKKSLSSHNYGDKLILSVLRFHIRTFRVVSLAWLRSEHLPLFQLRDEYGGFPPRF